MKKYFGLILLGLLLGSCTTINNSGNSIGSIDSLTPPPSANDSGNLPVPPSSEGPEDSTNSPSVGNPSIGSIDTTPIDVCDVGYKPGGENVDGSTRMPIPCNKTDKVALGNDNATMTSFSFKEDLPTDFRHIYGTNFTNPSFYSDTAGGGLKIDQPRKGIQTPMFVTNLKLEVRLKIGSVNNNSHGNEIDNKLPVMSVLAFDESGVFVRQYQIMTIDKGNENNNVRFYIDGTNVAYLEMRLVQYAYKGGQAYNFALLGIDMIAWPYALK